jgi:methionyl-tRNA synthetase
MINFDDFLKVELKIGRIIAAERVTGSDKLLKLEVDLGLEKRQVIAGIGNTYEPEFLINKEAPFVCNLEPRTLMGLESQAMILAADSGDGPVILFPEREVPSGSNIK